MALTPGTRLGVYEIIAPLGAGGMGEVYRATDSNLKRSVAIKVLPALVAGDADRLSRFQREAEVLAALNHPNIAAIYGLERAPDFTALVMELVEGEDLAQRIARGAIPLDEVLPIARQIADALEAAHDQGIIHRDLKPANIKVRNDGTVKVLDFGLAKAMDPTTSSPDLTQSPTITTPAMTRAGVILGTAAYMSPEQARGKTVDKRADIWAFGCVLFEMLTGKRAFHGEDVTDTLASVLKDDPDWTRLPRSVPASVRQALHQCLAREPKARIRDIADARLFLWPALPTGAAVVSAKRASTWRGVLVGATVVAAAFTAGWYFSRTDKSLAVRPARRVMVQLPAVLSGGTTAGGPSLAMAPDGNAIAFVARSGSLNRLFVHRLSDASTHEVRSPANATSPVFSWDSRAVAFGAGGKIWRAPLEGGEAELLCSAPQNPGFGAFRGGAWGQNGRVIFAAAAGLFEVVPGGQCQVALAHEGEHEARFLWPQILPRGRGTLVTVSGVSDDADTGSIVVVPAGTTQRRIIVRGARAGRLTASGHLLFARGHQIFAAPFDLDQLRVTAEPVVVLGGVAAGQNGLPLLGVSDLGDLVYASGQDTGNQMMWVTRNGTRVSAGAPPRSYQAEPRLSPDGRQVAVSIGTGDHFLWVFALDTGTLTPVASGRDVHGPVWSPDSRIVSYAVPGRGLALKDLDAAREPEIVPVEGADRPGLTTWTWSPDGGTLVHSRGSADGIFDLVALKLQNRTTRTLFRSSSNAFGAQFSPDGKWLAYASNESGRQEVYVTDFPTTQLKKLVSTDGGSAPVWSRDGKQLFYVAGTWMMTASVRSGAAIAFERPVRLFDGLEFLAGATPFSVAEDGRFLFVEEAQTSLAPRSQLTLVLNWLDELKRLVPPK